MTQATYILEGTEDNFPALVVENSFKGPVLVDFWATWVGPSHRQRELLTRLANEYAGRFLLVTVNTDKHEGLAHTYNVRSLPLSKLFRNGEVVETFHGLQPEQELHKTIDRYLVKESDLIHTRAIRAYKAGQVAEALRQLADAAVMDPENPKIPNDIAKILIAEGRLDEAGRLLGALPEPIQSHEEISVLRAHVDFLQAGRQAPSTEELEQSVHTNTTNLEAHYQLAAVRLIQDDYEGALQELFTILRQDRSFRQDVGRRGILAVFAILGDDHALVNRHRPQLFTILH